jgi:hypothetical protein
MVVLILGEILPRAHESVPTCKHGGDEILNLEMASAAVKLVSTRVACSRDRVEDGQQKTLIGLLITLSACQVAAPAPEDRDCPVPNRESGGGGGSSMQSGLSTGPEQAKSPSKRKLGAVFSSELPPVLCHLKVRNLRVTSR